VWRAARYANTPAGRYEGAFTDQEGRKANIATEKEKMLRCQSFHPNDNDQSYQLHLAGTAHTRITEQAVEGALYTQSAKKAPDPDMLTLGAIRLVCKWDEERIMRLTKAAIHTGRHPAGWKRACSVVIRKPCKDDYTNGKAYRSISLLTCMGKVVKKVIVEPLSEAAERGGHLSDGQFGSRKGQTNINPAAIMVDRAQAAWTYGYITGMRLMVIKAAFPSVGKRRLFNLIKVRQLDGDLIGWMESFLLK
jgi:hypothetical protein